MTLPLEDVTRLYRKLRLIRRAEEETARIYPSDKIKSPVHLAIGQEMNAVAVCDCLKEDDVIAGSYRSHAYYLAKGGSLAGMFAEMYGKDTGCARGKGGSMHIVDTKVNVLGASAVVGTNIPLAAGYALALEREGKGRVAVTFFGDGATEEGCFTETLNFAALHKLPILFVCENNFYAIHEPQSKRWATDRLCERVATYGIPTCKVTDGDIFAIRSYAEKVVAAMRQGAGPHFIECHAYRWKEHVGPNEDFNAGYRSQAEAEKWLASDQLPRLAQMLDAKSRAAIDAEIEKEIEKAVEFAETSPFPTAQELMTNVYA